MPVRPSREGDRSGPPPRLAVAGPAGRKENGLPLLMHPRQLHKVHPSSRGAWPCVLTRATKPGRAPRPDLLPIPIQGLQYYVQHPQDTRTGLRFSEHLCTKRGYRYQDWYRDLNDNKAAKRPEP